MNKQKFTLESIVQVKNILDFLLKGTKSELAEDLQSELISNGMELFEDQQKFIERLGTRLKVFGGKTPSQMILSGKIHDVIDILVRIKRGVYS